MILHFQDIGLHIEYGSYQSGWSKRHMRRGVTRLKHWVAYRICYIRGAVNVQCQGCWAERHMRRNYTSELLFCTSNVSAHRICSVEGTGLAADD